MTRTCQTARKKKKQTICTQSAIVTTTTTTTTTAKPDDVINSVNNLRYLSNALSYFHSCFGDLHSHLDLISASIQTLISNPNQPLFSNQIQNSDKNLVSGKTLISEKPLNSNETLISNERNQALISDKTTLIFPSKKPIISEKSQNSVSKNSPISEKAQNSVPKKSPICDPNKTLIPKKEPISEQCSSKSPNISDQSEIVTLSKAMRGDCVRKYIISNLSDHEKLEKEVPMALKLCPNPSKLVLDCIGEFYFYNTIAFENMSLNRSREASVLMLHFYLPMPKENLVKEEAEKAAMAWRTRMRRESGMGRASEIDAKGLLLFIGCYGIPDKFEDDDVLDLLKAGNGKEISGLLCRSDILVKKMKEIIEAKQKKKLDVEALHISLTFSLKVRYSPGSILTAFLIQSKKDWKIAMKSLENSNLAQAKVSFKKQHANLESLVKCLEEHKCQSSDLMAGWDPKKKMARLERELAKLDKRQDRNHNEKMKTKITSDQLDLLMDAENEDQPKSSQNARNNRRQPGKKLNKQKQDKDAELEKGRDESHKEKTETKRKADHPEPSMDENKEVKRLCSSHEPEQKNGAAFFGNVIPSPTYKLPISSSVFNRTGPLSLPSAGRDVLSRPYHYKDALIEMDALDNELSRPYPYRDSLHNERNLRGSFPEPEKFVSRRYVDPERFVGQSYVEPERFVGRSYVEPETFVGQSYVESPVHRSNGLSRSPLLSNPYMRYANAPPVAQSSDSDLYGFADTVIGREGNSISRANGSLPSVSNSPHSSYRY